MADQWATINTRITKRMEKIPRAVTTIMANKVIEISPVDTGRFRGNWFTWLENESDGGLIPVLKEFRVGQKIGFTNNLDYSLPLEFGHSDQAPAGMVGITVAQFPFLVNTLVNRFKNDK